MRFDDYQEKALAFALPTAFRLEYLIPALCEEVGEVASLYAKWVRNDKLDCPIDKNKIALEIGDCIWDLAVLCSYFGLSLQDVADANIAKLTKRLAEGTIAGGLRND